MQTRRLVRISVGLLFFLSMGTLAIADDAADFQRLKDTLTIGSGPIDEGRKDNRNSIGTGSVKDWLTYPGVLYVNARSEAQLYEGTIAYHFTGRERVADYILGAQRDTNDHQTSGRVTADYEITRRGSVLITNVRKRGGRGRVGNAVFSHVSRLNGRNLRESYTETQAGTPEVVLTDAVMIEYVTSLLRSIADSPLDGDSDPESTDAMEARHFAEVVAGTVANQLQTNPSVDGVVEELDTEALNRLLLLLKSAINDLESSPEAGTTARAALQQFANQLEVYREEVAESDIAEAIKDYRNSEPAKQAAKFLRKFAQGNEKSAGWKELSLNTSTGEIRGKAYIRSRHVVKVRIPLDGKKKVVVYDWTVKGSFRGNIKTGDGDGKIDFGRGIRVSVRDIIRILSGSELSYDAPGEPEYSFPETGFKFKPELQPIRFQKLQTLGLIDSNLGNEKQAIPVAELLLNDRNQDKIVPIESFFFEPPESVCDPDDRVLVQDTTVFPYSAVCQLIIHLPGNRRARGTGWLMGPQLVVTAGHCVHEGEGGGYFESVEVIPAMNGATRPFGSQMASQNALRASSSWISQGSLAGDYGAILLDRPFESDSGASPGVFETAVRTDAELDGAMLELSGYPGDKAFGEQWIDQDPVSSLQPGRIRYYLDTYGGQSGSGSRTLPDNQVVGIHNYGSCPNKSTRITAEVKSVLDAWRFESEQ